jgi:hypothetical protein
MTTYTGQREQDLARRVRRMLIEQSAVLQDENPDEFTWLTKNFVNEQRFFAGRAPTGRPRRVRANCVSPISSS